MNTIYPDSQPTLLQSSLLQTNLDLMNQSTFEFDTARLESPPNCFVFGLYTLAALNENIPSLASVFSEHSFSYLDDHHQHPNLIDPDTLFTKFGLCRQQSEPYLDVYADRVEGKMINLLAARCGIEAEVIPFTDFNKLMAYFGQQMAQQQPVLCDFDMGYIPSRHQYKIIRGYEHVVFFTQFDQNTQQLLLCDQDELKDPVPLADVEACFDSMLKMKGTFNCYQAKATIKKSQFLSPSDIRNDVRANVDNLTTTNPKLGMQAVNRYLESMKQVKPLNTPFYVFGHWVFALQRNMQVRWCDLALQSLDSQAQKTAAQELKQHLSLVANKWNEFTMLDKLSRKIDRVTPAQVAQKCIDAATLELDSPRYWQALQKVL